MMEKEETGVFNKCVSARAIIFYSKTNLYQNIFVKAACLNVLETDSH